jgi:hypothetical protein
MPIVLHLWRIILGLLLTSAILFAIAGGLLATTVHSLDLYVFRHYFVTSSGPLFLVSSLFLVGAFATWKVKLSR